MGTTRNRDLGVRPRCSGSGEQTTWGDEAEPRGVGVPEARAVVEAKRSVEREPAGVVTKKTTGKLIVTIDEFGGCLRLENVVTKMKNCPPSPVQV